jgi:hypothetical protein
LKRWRDEGRREVGEEAARKNGAFYRKRGGFGFKKMITIFRKENN